MEHILDFIPYFRALRPDERVRLLDRVELVTLAAGETRQLSAETPEWILVIDGEVDHRPQGGRTHRLFEADSIGEAPIITGKGHAGAIVAHKRSLLAVAGRGAFLAILQEMPAVAVPFLAELARDLKSEDDVLREAKAAQNAGLAQAGLTSLIERGLQLGRRRKRSIARHAGKVVWHTMVQDPARHPSFWMFAGVVSALISARTVVAVILENGLQSKLFALVESKVGHPVHVHHFNYGLLLTGVVGLLSMAPGMRRYLRALGFAFGFGLGLVVDEFALFWNLNPDYYQPESRVAAAMVVFLMFQLTYFFKLYTGLAKRLWAALVEPMSANGVAPVAFAKVPWLAAASELARVEVATRAVSVRFAPGRALMVELEPGDDLFILLEGKASVSVSDGRNTPQLVAELGPGDVCGELSLLTREVRSATVTAVGEVVALRLSRSAFERIIERHPSIAAHFTRVVAQRIADVRTQLMRLAHPTSAERTTVRLYMPPRQSLVRAWREIAYNNALELPMRALGAFALTLAVLRGTTELLQLGEESLLSLLRAGYTTGFVLVFAATATSLLRFRRRVQRWVALALGAGLGGIINGLSVFLAFDVFYLDMRNRDPALMFSVDMLYRRNESQWAVVFITFLLLQLAFMRRFYQRLWLRLRVRILP